MPRLDALDVQAAIRAHGLPPRVGRARGLIACAYDVAGHQVSQVERGPRIPVVGKQLPRKPVGNQCDVVPFGWLVRLRGDRDLGPCTEEHSCGKESGGSDEAGSARPPIRWRRKRHGLLMYVFLVYSKCSIKVSQLQSLSLGRGGCSEG